MYFISHEITRYPARNAVMVAISVSKVEKEFSGSEKEFRSSKVPLPNTAGIASKN